IDDAIDAVEGLTAPKRRDDDSVREAVRVALRRSIKVEFNRRPVVEIQLVRVS
ncbi:MAG: hypothetical protein HOL02_17655, partial [Rhodospirillaceae bacterium]|nr:hypothetical protein [Rhodospirillaceae bacterium]